MSEPRPRVLPGEPQPFGATVVTGGVNFALYSRGAHRVQLCLFDGEDGSETRFDLPVRTGYVWHGFLPGLAGGQLYGYRVHGTFDPVTGQRFNPAKLLVDPYARALTGKVDWARAAGALVDGAAADPRDSAPAMPRCVIWDDSFDWQGDTPPGTSWQDTVLYETHVKGFSFRHPDVPVGLRGTYLGIASEAAIRHFQSLGVTAVELLPVHAGADAERLFRQGLTNYWGYDSLAYFAPDARFSAAGDRGSQVFEFKSMVRELHRHGIEVILDVVYNHTAESDHEGPTLSFRGIDNATYYRLNPLDPARYVNFTGTGNTMNLRERIVSRLVLDSLRYWVQEMHVDGFRFDLAATLVRGEQEVEERSAFLDAVYQDPVLSRVKLIAEPWDLGPGGYHTGRFPAPWSEWNDRFRDSVRRYWRGDDHMAPDLARSITASAGLFATGERSPQASINYVTSHDGFTLEDLVSYVHKHNQPNGEVNQDGRDENFSANFGIEGPTTDPKVVAARDQQKRNFLATLLFSQGVPMLLGGDEIGRTQRGNNNAYNQDNEMSWYNWNLGERQEKLREFTSRLIAIRRRHPSLRRREFLGVRASGDAGSTHSKWLRDDGHEMTAEEWEVPWYGCFALLLNGELGELAGNGEPLRDDPLLLIFNASETDVTFHLPPGDWSLEVDTARPEGPKAGQSRLDSGTYLIAGRSFALLAGSLP